MTIFSTSSHITISTKNHHSWHAWLPVGLLTPVGIIASFIQPKWLYFYLLFYFLFVGGFAIISFAGVLFYKEFILDLETQSFKRIDYKWNKVNDVKQLSRELRFRAVTEHGRSESVITSIFTFKSVTINGYERFVLYYKETALLKMEKEQKDRFDKLLKQKSVTC